LASPIEENILSTLCLHRIASHRIASHRIASHLISSHLISSLPKFPSLDQSHEKVSFSTTRHSLPWQSSSPRLDIDEENIDPLSISLSSANFSLPSMAIIFSFVVNRSGKDLASPIEENILSTL
jgi:hypothetical protein